MSEIILPHGGFKKLKSYRFSVIVFDGTVRFTQRYFSRGDRTVDQMVQAARSCKQNIVEGSEAAGTSRETELKLTNVARASLGELLEDYEDFARLHNIALWEKGYRLYSRFSELMNTPDCNYVTLQGALEHQDTAIVVNAMVCLCRLTRYLLGKQIEGLERDFLNHGGVRERMTAARIKKRREDGGL